MEHISNMCSDFYLIFFIKLEELCGMPALSGGAQESPESLSSRLMKCIIHTTQLQIKS